MTTGNFGMGRVPSVDPRRMLYLAARALPSATERAADPPPVKKSHDLPSSALRFQGSTGTCTEHGAVHLVKASPVRTRAEARLWPQFSAYRQYILKDAWTQNDAEATGPDSGLQFGSSVEAAMRWLEENGYISGYAWSFRRADTSLWIRKPGGGPVVVGMNWYDSMFNLTREGFARITPNARVAGGHCWLQIGSDERRGVDLCANSWENWGIDRRAFNTPGKYELGTTPRERKGFFLMAAEDTERLHHENGEAAMATERRWKPRALGAAA